MAVELDHPYQLYVAAMKSIPVPVKRGSVEFAYAGILSTTDRKESGNEDKFYRECIAKGVIPESSLRFDYNSNIQTFRLMHHQVPTYSNNPEASTRSIEYLLDGLKAQILHFVFEGGTNGVEAYEIFRHRVLDSTINRGYLPTKATLFFVDEFTEKDISSAQFNVTPRYGNSSLQIRTGDDISDDQKTSLKIWHEYLPKRKWQ